VARPYTSDSIWMTEDEAREYWLRRLYLDMVAVLEKITVTSVGELLSPPIAQELWTELSGDYNKASRARGTWRREFENLQLQLAKPPAPWKTFGHFANTADPNVAVTFWGDDGTGLPIWERETIAFNVEAVAQAIADYRRRMSTDRIVFKGSPPIGRDVEAAKAVIAYLEGGMNDG